MCARATRGACLSSSRRKPRPELGLTQARSCERSPNARNLDRPASATAWRFLTHGSRASKLPSGCSRFRHGIDFDAIDGEPVDIVFSLLLPESGDGANRNALACVARALRETEILRQLRHACDREALFRAITGPAIA